MKKKRIRKLRTFTIDDDVFKTFRNDCKKKGRKMSREIETRMRY